MKSETILETDSNFGTIPNDWLWKTIDQIKESEKGSLVSGPFGSNIGSRFFQYSGIPLIRGNNLTTGREKFIDDGFVFISKEKAEELKNCSAIKNDIIFTAAGTIGQVGIVPQNTKYDLYIISNKQLRLRVNSSIINPLFAYYWLSSKLVREYLIRSNVGSSVPLLTLRELKNVIIPIPSLREQNKIVSILESLYNMISILEEINTILEKIIQAIFKSWFVDFDGQTEFVDSELGQIPKGWNYEILDNFLERITYGFTCPMPTSQDGPYMITAKDLEGDRINFIRSRRTTQQSFEKNLTDKSRPVKNDILLSKDGTLGRLAIVGDEKICVNQSVAVLRPNSRISSYFLYYLLKSPQYQKTMINHADGSVIQHIYITRVNQMFILVPENSIKIQFEKICENVYKKIDINFKKVLHLSNIRDSLLPKLMSGEIRV